MAFITKHVKISGMVQGVGFRAWTHKEALGQNITGWVKNCDDGTVEVSLEGETEIIHEMIEKLRLGPKFSKVERLEILSEAEETYQSILRSWIVDYTRRI